MFKNYELTLDIATGDARHPLIQVNTNDLDSFKISFIITQHKEPIDLTGKTIRIAILKPDRKTVLQDCTLTDAENGKGEVILDTQAYALGGKHYAEVMVYDGAEKVAVTGRFVYNANRGILNDGTVESTNEWQSINQAIADAEGKLGEAEAILIDLRENGTGVDAQARQDLESVTAQLAQNVQQVDLVSLLQKKNYISDQIYARTKGEKSFEVSIPFKGNKVANYHFYRAGSEEFLRLIRGDIATLNTINQKVLAVNYQSKTGVWNESYLPNAFTTEIGATMTLEFEGTGIYFQHVADSRGGIWEFIFDDDPNTKVTISCWLATGTTTKKQLVKNDLPSGSHKVVATFKGDDPLNPPSEKARGWACFNGGTDAGKETFDVYDNSTKAYTDFPVYAPASNIEFAIGMKPKDSALTEYFVPDHGTKVTFVDKLEVYFDDELITDWVSSENVRPVKVVKVYQEILAKHPNDLNNPMARLYSLHTITAQGVEFFTKVKYLRDVSCKDGYALMLPCDNTFASKLITSVSNVYDATKRNDTNTDLTENDSGLSFAFINEGGESNRPNVVMAMTLNNPYKTLRMGKTGRRTPLYWLQHRSTTMQKLYPQSFKDAVMLAGEMDEFSGTLYISELPNANLLLA